MTQVEQTMAAKEFAERWTGRGDEKQESQRFWIDLLHTVLGAKNAENCIEFEKPVKLTHTSFIDAYIAETKVLIEQKGADIDLHKAYKQSDGAVLSPYQQAKRYM
ncbi:MAG: methylase, partial [Treponema sp.]|nr:methylase [Treponema sp.]